MVALEYPCSEFLAVEFGAFWRLPSHEVFGRVGWRIVGVVLAQPPLARVLHRLEAEGPTLGADDEAAVLKKFEEAGRCSFVDVKRLCGLAHRIWNLAVVVAPVSLDDSDVERVRIARQTVPCP